MSMIDVISLITGLISIPLGILAIYLAIKSGKTLTIFKEYVEVFFEKERMLRGYDHHTELFKPIVNKPEDIEIVKKDIIKYQLGINQIFSDESNHRIWFYNCLWDDFSKNKSSPEIYTIEIIKESNRKSMPQIHHLNKSKTGQFGIVVKIKSSGKTLKKDSYYFIFFRLGGIREKKTNLWIPQGCWMITETIDYKNNKYPFLFEGDFNKSSSLTANEFMKKINKSKKLYKIFPKFYDKI